ncbi:MAG: putative quorum-sensing-regulated virulence factor [Armatimonadota bacterium]
MTEGGVPKELLDLIEDSAPADGFDFGGNAHIEDGEVVLDFGQHEGEALGDVPTGYLQWMISEDFPQDLLDEVEDELLGRFNFDD